MSKLGSLYIKLGEPEGELCGGCCEIDDWAADEIERLQAQIALLREAATNLVNFILHPCWDADETIPELVAMQTVLAATEGEK